jgi:hypothetical protein
MALLMASSVVQPLTAYRHRKLHPDIVLGPPRPTSPPLLVALPFLLLGQHQQRPP